jgi:hypothetical protein
MWPDHGEIFHRAVAALIDITGAANVFCPQETTK